MTDDGIWTAWRTLRPCAVCGKPAHSTHRYRDGWYHEECEATLPPVTPEVIADVDRRMGEYEAKWRASEEARQAQIAAYKAEHAPEEDA